MVKRFVLGTLLASLLFTICTLFVLPMVSANWQRPFTPTQLEAIAEKERARQAHISAFASSYQQSGSPAWTAQPGDSPQASFGSYESERIYVGPPDPFAGDDEFSQPDSVNLFFGGAGSIWDIEWDIEHDFYTRGIPTPSWDEGNDGRWSVGERRDNGQACNRKYLSVNGQDVLNDIELVSRDAKTLFPLPGRPCDNALINTFMDSNGILVIEIRQNHRMHVRIWGGGCNETDGCWSVAAAHWDSDDHKSSRHIEDTEDILVGAFTDEFGNPLWFVQAIWEFDVLGNDQNGRNANSRGCLRDIEAGSPNPCDGRAHYIQLAA